ncbi:UPF0182 family protein [Limnothrix sp. FACHB-1083]|uniref:UPF0182 family protein n=1 Tax=unclassified Limnothrix TaxID=2632864 RepID=UPI0016808420|nr:MULTISPECIES: UPF0182 family protein [unclassified Limnothrix]MBD2159890.1 UPF0182 family protein [Limnothrix sp. FACHB-1083]MBD2190591.1 UPF0182 family protein [Limnothrix sp. FACHB-1088]
MTRTRSPLAVNSTPPIAAPDRARQQPWRWALGGLGFVLAIGLAVRWLGDGLWFGQLGYGSLWWMRLAVQAALFGVGAIGSLAVLWGNLWLAEQLNRRESVALGPDPDRPWWVMPRAIEPRGERLVGGRLDLLPLLLVSGLLALGLALLVVHYGQIGWTAGREALPTAVPRLQPLLLWELLEPLRSGQWWWLALPGCLWALGAIAPRWGLRALGAIAALNFAWIGSQHWATILLAAHPSRFQQVDPVFGLDVGWFVFGLPLVELLEFWAIGLLLWSALLVGLYYLLSQKSLARGRFPGFTVGEWRHGCGLLGLVLLAAGISAGVACFDLLNSTRGAAYGAGFADIRVQLPANIGLGLVSLGSGVWLLGYALTGLQPRRWLDGRVAQPTGDRRPDLPPRLVAIGLLCYAIGGISLGFLLPEAVQGAIVEPNELERERPYIERNIAFTRSAFGLDRVQAESFDPQATLSAADLQTYEPTLDSVRLWDTNPLLDTNRQLQQIRSYYRFANADLDRYRLPDRPNPAPAATDRSTLHPTILSMRELDTTALSAPAQTWLNRHLVYTHGYGFTLSPANQVGAGGLPLYWVRDIGSGTDDTGGGILRAANGQVSQGIPLDRPRVYFGELTNTYILAPTAAQELDYPRGNDNAYNHYDGQGGVLLGDHWWKRWLLAAYLRDWQLLLTNNLTPDTRLLWRRNVRERVRTIAPFLQFDRDPYAVAVNLQSAADADGFDHRSHLFWIVDGYTTSRRYPYSEPSRAGFNYIRNSVKAVIDAYNGTVRFYVADGDDPLIRSWQAVFPELLRPIDQCPPAIRSHFRYPIDLFAVQSEKLLTYHMSNPQEFYNREDLWQIPNEIYGNQPQPIQPYFALMQLPGTSQPEFVQLLPFSPAKRSNLIGWLAARSDGDRYGRLLLYQFPKDRLVFGIEQVEARINQDPDIARQISLWNRQGSKVIQGNLVAIPIGRSILYVEPLYLAADAGGLPTLIRLVVAHGDRIVMQPTLDTAITAMFGQRSPAPQAAPPSTS